MQQPLSGRKIEIMIRGRKFFMYNHDPAPPMVTKYIDDGRFKTGTIVATGTPNRHYFQAMITAYSIRKLSSSRRYRYYHHPKLLKPKITPRYYRLPSFFIDVVSIRKSKKTNNKISKEKKKMTIEDYDDLFFFYPSIMHSLHPILQCRNYYKRLTMS